MCKLGWIHVEITYLDFPHAVFHLRCTGILTQTFSTCFIGPTYLIKRKCIQRKSNRNTKQTVRTANWKSIRWQIYSCEGQLEGVSVCVSSDLKKVYHITEIRFKVSFNQHKFRRRFRLPRYKALFGRFSHTTPILEGSIIHFHLAQLFFRLPWTSIERMLSELMLFEKYFEPTFLHCHNHNPH